MTFVDSSTQRGRAEDWVELPWRVGGSSTHWGQSTSLRRMPKIATRQASRPKATSAA